MMMMMMMTMMLMMHSQTLILEDGLVDAGQRANGRADEETVKTSRDSGANGINGLLSDEQPAE